MKKPENKQNGFTLIELLVVIGIIGVIGSILVSTVFSTLRGSNKGAIANTIRSEGNYAMQSMVRSLQEADTFDGVSNDFSVYSKPCPTTFTSYRSVKINGSSFVSCPSGGNMGSFSALNTGAVMVSSCSVSCMQASSIDNPSFRIDFTLMQGSSGKAASGLFENVATVDFSTTVRMRNPVQ